MHFDPSDLHHQFSPRRGLNFYVHNLFKRCSQIVDKWGECLKPPCFEQIADRL